MVSSNTTASAPTRRTLFSSLDGFISLKFGLLRCEVEKPLPAGITSDERMAFLKEHLDQCERTHWPAVWAALLKGELHGYGEVPHQGKRLIDAHFWALLPNDRLPASIQWNLTQNQIHPVIRLGDLEWFIARQSGRSVWTVDQALIWLCARSIELVQRACTQHGTARLTWPQFLQMGNFAKVTPGEAFHALKADLHAFRIKAWSGLRPLNPGVVLNAAWHRVIEDPLSFWTLRNSRDELQAIVLDPSDVMALYPVDIDAAVSRAEGVREPDEEASTQPGIMKVKATARGEARCVQYLAAEMQKSPNKRLKSQDKYRPHCEAEFGVTNRGFIRAWAAAVKETGAAAWSAGGRPKNSGGTNDLQ